MLRESGLRNRVVSGIFNGRNFALQTQRDTHRLERYYNLYIILLVSAKNFGVKIKLGLIPFWGFSPFGYFCLWEKIYNHEQKYTFLRTADIWTTNKIS